MMLLRTFGIAAALALLTGNTFAQPAPPVRLSHAWIVVTTGAPQRAVLEKAGFTIAPTVNRHDGQGTASVTVEFLNGFFELIYPDPTVSATISPAGAEKFRLKSRWRETGYSPIGIVFDRLPSTPATFPFPTWKISVDWMEKGTFIEMLTPRETPKALSLSISSTPAATESQNLKLARDPVKGAVFRHANGARRLTALRVIAPSADALPASAKYLGDHGIAQFTVGSDWLLELTLDEAAQKKAKDLRPDLPLIIHY